MSADGAGLVEFDIYNGGDFILSPDMTIAGGPFFWIYFVAGGSITSAGHQLVGLANDEPGEVVTLNDNASASQFEAFGEGAGFYGPDYTLTLRGEAGNYFYQDTALLTVDKVILETGDYPIEMDIESADPAPLPALEINGPGEVFQDFPVSAISFALDSATINGGVWNISGLATAIHGHIANAADFSGGSTLIATSCTGEDEGNINVIFVSDLPVRRRGFSAPTSTPTHQHRSRRARNGRFQ